MRNRLTKEQAIEICRNPERSVREAERVLQWAGVRSDTGKDPASAPAELGGFAAVKGFIVSRRRNARCSGQQRRIWTATKPPAPQPPGFGETHTELTAILKQIPWPNPMHS